MSDEALAQIMSAINSLGDRIGSLESGMSTISGEIHGMKGDIHGMKGDIHDVKEELRDVKAHITIVSQSNVQIMQTLDRQKGRIDDIDRDLAATEVDLERSMRQQRRMNERLARIESEE